MNDTTIERHENPHVTGAPGPLLARHPFRPTAFLFGLALVALGATFLAHQLGAIELGPVPTVLLGTVVLAAVLVGIALEWTRNHGEVHADPPPSGEPDDQAGGDG